MNAKLAEFQQLISLTQAMLEQAQSSSWDDVIKLEATRRSMISAFFLTPVLPELTSTVSEGIRLIMSKDEKKIFF